MAKQILTNVRYFCGPADLTAQTNKVELEWTAEDKETTNFGSNGKKERIAGIEDVMINAEGQYEAGDPGYADDAWWDDRTAMEAHTIGPHTAAVGSAAYITEAVRLSEKLFGPTTDVAMFTLNASGNAGLGVGMFAHAPALVTVDGDGTAFQLGAVPAGKRLVASLHVLSVDGTSPELTVTIESDSVEAFSGSPETRLTFSTFDAAGSEIQRSAIGAHADTWYRASFDVEGTDPSFLVVVAVGID